MVAIDKAINKARFIAMFGYFKVTRSFYEPSMFHENDIDYIARRYDLKIDDISSAKNTIALYKKSSVNISAIWHRTNISNKNWSMSLKGLSLGSLHPKQYSMRWSNRLLVIDMKYHLILFFPKSSLKQWIRIEQISSKGWNHIRLIWHCNR